MILNKQNMVLCVVIGLIVVAIFMVVMILAVCNISGRCSREEEERYMRKKLEQLENNKSSGDVNNNENTYGQLLTKEEHDAIHKSNNV